MIRIMGSTEGPEAAAARQMRDAILASWPWVETDPGASVEIIAGVQCHGQLTRDLDVVLLAVFPPRARFTPFLSFQRRGDRLWAKPGEVRLDSLCLIIEVKDHDQADVRFEGTRLEVRYRHEGVEQWHGASEQSHKQIFALRNYLSGHRLDAPYITNLIWLRQVPNLQIPPRPHNVLGAGLTWELILNVIAQLNPPVERDGEWVFEAWHDGGRHNFPQIVRVLTQRLQPTRLDSLRMARLARAALAGEWVEDIGAKQIIFRGRGGTGKTMILLQLAWKLYEEQGARVLLLTYNKALMADLRRLLTLVGVGDPADSRGIQVQSVHSFLGSAFRGLGLLGQEDDLLECYDRVKRETLDLIRGGGLTAADVERLIRERSEAFGWDYLLIDEGQDWPEDERDLLRGFYPARRFAIADGMDQLVRSEQPCDWRAGLPRADVRIVPLGRCLRMKVALARFTNELAGELGLGGWHVEENPEATGGRVIIVDGDYFAARPLHDRIMRANEADGNQPVDILVCVPPVLVIRGADTARSTAADRLSAWGHSVWDGVSTEVRDSYATSVAQVRVVQYDSCRGLEGWAVVHLGLDEFYRYKRASWRPPSGAEGELTDDPAAAHRFAARWLMIPLTRAVDTFVIEVGPQPSPLREALGRVAARCPDFVEWHTPST
jgi:hypothetical protein